MHHYTFTIQLMLEMGPGVQWLNQKRRELYPRHGRAHISVLPYFQIREDRYQDLVDELSDLANQWEAFEFEAVGMCRRDNGCVAIEVADDDGVLDEIMEEIPPLVGASPNRFPPHVTIYRGSPNATYFPHFDKVLGLKKVQRWVKEKLDQHGDVRGRPLWGNVIGLQLVEEQTVVESFPFGS
ncbi:hypothetical protein DFH06DRAFT_600182 [Mycena polygramma]|nr:hypothetical protein DFH06DRAFT_192144 [Mycena polygramma]KAJ7642949.1 hypothetical protein DFH06DRAFT_600182 [Mycena polygramma]